MHYEINVARYKDHFFATHARSIQDRAKLLDVLAAIVKAFPKSEGYSVSVSEYRNEGRCISVDELLPPTPPARQPLVRRWWREDLDLLAAQSDPPCPGCGCRAGEGVTAGCTHPEGCGFATEIHGAGDR
jgi:hypothetical protein